MSVKVNSTDSGTNNTDVSKKADAGATQDPSSKSELESAASLIDQKDAVDADASSLNEEKSTVGAPKIADSKRAPNTPTDAAQSQDQDPQESIERKKQKSRAANRAAVQLLCEHYPQAFSLTAIQPLKVGIQKELAAYGKISQTKIKRGLASYARQFAYLRSQKAGAVRINSKGEPSGEVTAEEAQHAQSKLPTKLTQQHVAKGSNDKKPAQRLSVKFKVKPKSENKTGKPNHQNNKKAPKVQPKRAHIEKAASPYQGMGDSQRFESKLALLLSKNKSS